MIDRHTDEFIEQDTNTLQFNAVLNFFNHKRDGVFVEMGAADGILASNTFRLERDYGWNGVLIEPLKDYYEQIPCYRKTRHVYNICIGETEGDVDFTRIEGYSKLLSGISNEYPKEHVNRIASEVNSMNQQVYVDKVPCRRLINVLNECGINHIDYLSVDVEGGELSVMKSLSMETNSIRPVLIGSENNYRNTEVEEYLNTFGYVFVGNAGGDNFFFYDGKTKP